MPAHCELLPVRRDGKSEFRVSFLLAKSMQKHNSHLKGDNTGFTPEPNMSGHDLGTRIQATQNSMFQQGNNFSKFLWNYEYNKSIHYSSAFVETPGRQDYRRAGQFSWRFQVLSDGLLSHLVPGS